MRVLTLLSIILCTAIPAVSSDLNEDRTRSLFVDFVEAEYSALEASPFATGILYDLVAPISRLSEYDGSGEAPPVTAKQWMQLSFELKRASLVESVIPDFRELKQLGNAEAKKRVYPIAILDFEYNRFRPNAEREQAITFKGERIAEVDEGSVETAKVFAAAALRDWSYRGRQVTFRVDRNNLYFTNSKEPVSGIEIDFDDGLGFRRAAGNVSVYYSQAGDKIIRVRALRDNEIVESSFRFEVRSLDTPDPHETWQVTATIPHDGNYSTGEAYVYLSDLHSSITNPIILAEGIDLDNSRNWDELYDMLNQEGLVEDVREMGFDIVVLNHDDGVDYIQGNAYLLVELINQVNAVSADNSSIILVGVSMGGQTTRFALTYMEANDLPHNVSTWISFDSPHRGANIPLGIQYWVDFFAGQASEAGVMRDALNSPAAKQLLLVHFTNPPSTNVGPDPLRADFLNDMDAIGGFPESMRRVTIANGSGIVQGLDFTPGDQLIRWEYSSFLVDITGNSWSLNNVQTDVIFEGEVNQIWPLPDESRTVAIEPTWPYDNAPGGKTNSMEEMDAVNTGGYGDIIALETHHCFIPTVSALNLAVVDPFYSIDAHSNLYTLTPFDSIYYPTWNQSHSFIYPENYGWFMGELLLTMPEPALDANPAVVAFGQVHVDSVAELSVSLANDGTWDVTVSSLAFANGSAFSLVDAPSLPLTIPFSSSTGITVQFDPAEVIEYVDTLQVFEDDHLLTRIPINGQGVAAQIAVNADSLQYDSVIVGEFGELSFTIENSGQWELTVEDLVFETGAVFAFIPQPTPPITISQQSDLQLTVRFMPTTAGNFSDSLTILHDAGDPIGVYLEGIGQQAGIRFVPDTLDFLQVWIQTTEYYPVWIENTGDATLFIDSVYSEDEVFEFVVHDLTIEPGLPQTVTLPCTPQDTLEYTGHMTAVTNIGTFTAFARVQGVWSEVVIEPESVELTGVVPNEEILTTITMTNLGNALILLDPELAVGSAFQISVPPPPPYLAAYAVDSVVVRFSTTVDTAGVYRDTLRLRSPELYLQWIPFSAEVVSGTATNESLIPREYYLAQNYPNPFNPSTTLNFGLPQTSDVVLSVYDLQGRLVEEIVRSSFSAGRHAVQWECASCASGLYMFVLDAGGMQFVRKGMLLK